MIDDEVYSAIERLKEYGNTVIKEKYYKMYTVDQLKAEFEKRGARVDIVIKKMVTPVASKNKYNDGSWISKVIYLKELL